MLAERLEQVVDLSFEPTSNNLGKVASLFFGDPWPKEQDVDDLMAGLARYLRVPWGWMEEQPFPRLLRMSEALGRLLRAENGKRDPLDLRAASEENR